MNTFKIACPECNQTYKVSKTLLGRRTRCLTCQTPFRLPKPSLAVAALVETPASKMNWKIGLTGLICVVAVLGAVVVVSTWINSRATNPIPVQSLVVSLPKSSETNRKKQEIPTTGNTQPTQVKPTSPHSSKEEIEESISRIRHASQPVKGTSVSITPPVQYNSAPEEMTVVPSSVPVSYQIPQPEQKAPAMKWNGSYTGKLTGNQYVGQGVNFVTQGRVMVDNKKGLKGPTPISETYWIHLNEQGLPFWKYSSKGKSGTQIYQFTKVGNQLKFVPLSNGVQSITLLSHTRKGNHVSYTLKFDFRKGESVANSSTTKTRIEIYEYNLIITHAGLQAEVQSKVQTSFSGVIYTLNRPISIADNKTYLTTCKGLLQRAN